jgi:hypothetical protein
MTRDAVSERAKAKQRSAVRSLMALAVVLLSTVPLTGCLVMGYSSGGGFFIWPGSLALLVVLALLYFFLRGR